MNCFYYSFYGFFGQIGQNKNGTLLSSVVKIDD